MHHSAIVLAGTRYFLATALSGFRSWWIVSCFFRIISPTAQTSAKV